MLFKESQAGYTGEGIVDYNTGDAGNGTLISHFSKNSDK